MNREIGGLLGYPQTAVDYFLERDEALDSELDKARNAIVKHLGESVLYRVSKLGQQVISNPDFVL